MLPFHQQRTTIGHSRVTYDSIGTSLCGFRPAIDCCPSVQPPSVQPRCGTSGSPCMSAPATSGAKPPTLPLSKARRELAELLEHARTLEADGDTTRLLSQDSPTSGEGGGPQIARWGVKINDEYCIIAARRVDEDRRLRFDVYNTRTSTQHALVCRHADVVSSGETSVAAVARAIALDLRFDGTNRLVFGPHVPASWVSHD